MNRNQANDSNFQTRKEQYQNVSNLTELYMGFRMAKKLKLERDEK